MESENKGEEKWIHFISGAVSTSVATGEVWVNQKEKKKRIKNLNKVNLQKKAEGRNGAHFLAKLSPRGRSSNRSGPVGWTETSKVKEEVGEA